MISDLGITTVVITEKHTELLLNVSVRIIQHHLQKDLKMTTRRTVKPLLTEAMMKKRLQLCIKYKDYTLD